MTSDKFRILAVDDDEDLRALVDAALSDAYEVVTANNGLDALVKLPKVEPDLFILDLMMPLMDGWELLAKLRQQPGHAKTPVVLLTALNKTEDIKKGYALGASVYLTKPFELPRLLRNIDVALRGSTPRAKKHAAKDLPGVLHPENAPRPAAPAPAPPPAHAAPPPPEATPSGVFLRPVTGPATPTPRSLPTAPPPVRVPGAPHGATSGVISRFDHGPAAVPAGERPRILLVESDAEVAEQLRHILDQLGDTYLAHDGVEAKEQVADVEPDLLVIATKLRRMNGYVLVDAIRELEEYQATPILLVTDRDVYKERLAVANKGVKHVIGKPIRPHQFHEMVGEIVKSADFRVRPKAAGIAELLLHAGRRRASAVEQRAAGGISGESKAAFTQFLRENKRPDQK
ncbi:MAG: response regulator [Candidatus Sumerlaeia bacterium]|nr:response regulator [Candidatus Sumerlaeia bacterium]